MMKDIEKNLSAIPNEYRAIPFWSWNDKLQPDELRNQIRWMKENGIGGFFMHARGGLKTPYMSDEWMECVEACCDEAQKLQMDAWGYDENGWPSGFAGGKLLEDEKNRDCYLIHTIGAFDADATVSYLLSADRLKRVTEPQTDGEYLNISIRRSVSTVDILDPKVVQKFIDLTHEKYKEHFGKDFSKKFKGFFTDEPQFYRGGGTPYSPMVADYFAREYGEDLLDSLGLLFVKKEGYRSFRYRYWLAMQQLMLNAFAKMIYQWCEDNGVEFTGHYIEENTLGGQLVCCGGIMPFYEYMHTPGIDWLGKDTVYEIGPHQVGSVARQLGKKHALTETFAGCGWNADPQELHRIAGYQYANGVNLMCHHLMPYSEHGQRKRDYPIHFTKMNPWVKDDFKQFNEHFTKLGYLLASSEEPVNVAILHPIRSAYMEFQPEAAQEEYGIRDLEDSLRAVCRALSSRGIPYHFLDETIMKEHGYVEGDKIGCGNCRYEYLVLPRIYTMAAHTERFLRKFVENSGKVILADARPCYLEDKPFDYAYLTNTVSFEEVFASHDFSVGSTQNDLYYAYRFVDGEPMIFVQNASDRKAYHQSFAFKGSYTSFVKLDLDTMETSVMPLEFTIRESEHMVLFPSSEMVNTKALDEISCVFHDAVPEFEMNYLTIDEVSYSKDGITYSKPIYVNKLFKNLLQERYDGHLWLKYNFEVEKIPESLHLLAEEDNIAGCKLNGCDIQFTEEWEDEKSFCIADISRYVRKGINSYEIDMPWTQTEETYYALFGENVTETLKNCIVYKGEIEAVYLRGKFGVYSHKPFTRYDEKTICGSDFYIGEVPAKVSELATDGFPFVRGKVKLQQMIHIDQPQALLHVEGEYLSAKVWVNDSFAGELFFKKRIDISKWAVAGENKIAVEFNIGNRNLLGPNHSTGTELFIVVPDFEVSELKSDESGSTVYRLQRFYR